MKLTTLITAFTIATTAILAAPGSPDKAQPPAAAWTTPCDSRGTPIPQANDNGWPPVCGSPEPDRTCTSVHNRTCTYNPKDYTTDCTYVGCVESFQYWENTKCNQCIDYEKECLADVFSAAECKDMMCGEGKGLSEEDRVKVRMETKQCRGPELPQNRGGKCHEFCEGHA